MIFEVLLQSETTRARTMIPEQLFKPKTFISTQGIVPHH